MGHAARTGRATGCTVVLCPEGAVGGVAQRGGSPGTRETDLLRPENSVQQVHAVLLAGGSAYGLDAASGVMRWLDEQGHGLPVGPARVPIVPAAVLFDLWFGDPRIRPDAATGHAACIAATAQAPEQGSVGAGLGASVGKRLGIARAMKGGLGTSSIVHDGFTVGALVAVNAVGNVLGEDGRVIAGVRGTDGRSLAAAEAALFGADAVGPGIATTIGVVATDASLSKAQASQLASLAHHGVARAVSPISPNDGDTFFALATGRQGWGPGQGDLTLLGALAAEAVARAIRNAVRAASAVPGVPLPALRDLGA